MKSRAALIRAAPGKASVKDMEPMRDVAKRVNDGFCTGRWLAAELIAIIEHLAST